MWNWVSKLEELRASGTQVVLVTLVAHSGSSPREAGAKMIVLRDGAFFGTVGGGQLEKQALEDAKGFFESGTSGIRKYPLGAMTGQCCGGSVELFFETVNKGPRVYLFGAGHVGQALSRSLTGTPFRVHLIDERAEWVRSESVPREVLRHECEWDDFAEEAQWCGESTYVVVMTHRHDVDQKIIEFVAQKPTRYVGLIGSESKWARFKQRFETHGLELARFEKVRCPIGLKTGGKAPQEVAISVAAELLSVHYGHA